MSCGFTGCPYPEKRDGWCLYHLPKKDLDETNSFISFVGRQIEDQSSGQPSFEGFVFPAGFQFRKGQSFGKHVNFSKAIFEGGLLLDEVNFQLGVTFDEANLQGDFVVKGSAFGSAGFINAQFYSLTTFTKTYFENVRIENTQFHEYVQFLDAKFDGDVTFDSTTFHQNANFSGTTFFGTVGFLGVDFQLDAFFGPSKNPTSFAKYTTFAQSVFSRTAYFVKAIFNADANFDNARFQNTASFDDAAVMGRASFFNSTFYAQAHFAGTHFHFAKFHYTVFKDVVSFKAPSKDIPTLIFHFVSFEKPGEVSFYRIPFSSLSFLRTDVSETLIVPPTLSISKEGILDEELLEFSKGQKISSDRKEALEEAAKILQPYLMDETVIYEYKNLRKSLESNRLYNEAADLFIREMRMARSRASHFEFIASWLYDKISCYGESMKRPTELAVVVVFGMALVLDLAKNVNYINRLITLDALQSGLLTYLAYVGDVLAVFFQMRDFNHTANLQWAPLAAEIFLRLSSLILLGTLFIAVKRRLERK